MTKPEHETIGRRLDDEPPIPLPGVPVDFTKVDNRSMYLVQQLSMGEADGRKVTAFVTIPSGMLVFRLKDAHGEAQYTVSVESLIMAIDGVRDAEIVATMGDPRGVKKE